MNCTAVFIYTYVDLEVAPVDFNQALGAASKAVVLMFFAIFGGCPAPLKLDHQIC
jgi:hypothetical protein